MARSRKRQVMSEINVVPYIDVMLVLLVIFMVTAPMLNPTVVNLPSVDKSSQPQDAQQVPLEVIIKSDTSMLLRERVQGKPVDHGVNMSSLIDAVKQKQASSPDRPVVISADKDVRYEAVLKVMDELKKQNVARVGLMVKPAH
jgi:biopolymer transport protein TolR